MNKYKLHSQKEGTKVLILNESGLCLGSVEVDYYGTRFFMPNFALHPMLTMVELQYILRAVETYPQLANPLIHRK